MATHTVLSEPRQSRYHPNWFYVYYDAKTNDGRNCIAVIPNSLKGIVHRGTTFEDTQLKFDPELRASVLEMDFHEPPPGDPSLPPDQDSGWRDSDYRPAELGDPEQLREVMNRLESLHGSHQATQQQTPQQPPTPQMDPALQTLVDQACLAYTYASRKLGVVEKPRSMEAQKLITTCLIPWLRDRGVALTPDEERAMTL
ncbi:MAG: hypothetical protein ACO4AL_11360 [Steroidobacteraceae bacterium]